MDKVLKSGLMRLRFIFFFILILSILTCGEKGTDLKGIDIVENSDIPKYSNSILKFKEELTLSNDEWIDGSFLVDDEGAIYFFNIQKDYIEGFKYDKDGKLIFSKKFPRGQGPGDIFNPYPVGTSNGKIWIYDKGNRRVVILSKDLNFEKLVKIEKPIFCPQIDSIGNLYGYEFGFGLGREKGNIKFKKFFANFKKAEEEYFQYSFNLLIKDEKDGSSIFRPYEPFGIVRSDKEGNLYYAISDKYEINKISQEGKLIKRITKKASSRPFKVTEEKIQKLKERFSPGGKAIFKYKFEFPKFYPSICNFFVLENDFLLVLTYENEDTHSNIIAGDLFNDKGILLSKVEVPIYFNPYFSERGLKEYENSILKKGYFYTQNFDDVAGKFSIKRYKVEITENPYKKR